MTTTQSIMQRWLGLVAFMMGLTQWFPSLGIHLGDFTLQPADLVILAGCPLLLAYRNSFRTAGHLTSILFLLSILFAILSFKSQMLTIVYHLVFILPFMMLVYLFTQNERSGWSFLQGFLLGAVPTFLAVLFQGYGTLFIDSHAFAFDPRTNLNFSTPHYSRAYGWFAEPSLLAANTLMSLCCSIILVRLGDDRLAMHPVMSRRSVQALLTVITVGVIVPTVSSSVIFLMPLLLTIVYLYTIRKGTVGSIITMLAFIVLLVCVILAFWLFVYSPRRAGEVATGWGSIVLRFAGFLSPIYMIREGNLLGVGLGNNHQVLGYYSEAMALLGYEWVYMSAWLPVLPAGITSSIIQRIFEEGIFSILSISLGLYYLCKVAIVRPRRDAFGTSMFILSLASCVLGLFITGYRGIYTIWFWYMVPAALLDWRLAEPRVPVGSLPKIPLYLDSILVPPVPGSIGPQESARR